MILNTPKGFRDFLPKEARQRNFVIGKMAAIFASFGFEPLETPALEYAETLKEEIALNVAAQLEEAGYTVTGKPKHRQTYTRADKLARLSRNLAAQNWAA